MSKFSHLFEYDERDVSVPVPTDSIPNELHFNEILKSIATYQNDDYFSSVDCLNTTLDRKNMCEDYYDKNSSDNEADET